MGLFSVIVPEAGTNLILNPSGELSGNFGAHNSATVTLVTTHARYGKQCFSIVTGATNRGMTLTVGALANAIHYLTFYARKDTTALTGTLEVSANGGVNYNTASIISGALADSNSRWIRYGVSIPAAQASGSTSIIIRDTVNENFYVDAAMLQQLTYATTYIDGDRAGLYRWNGLRHASTSTRNAQERAGGRERDLTVDYGVAVDPVSKGYGYPPIDLNFFPQPLQPGSLFQSDKLSMRELLLNVNINLYESGTPTTYQQLMQKRKAFLALLRSNQYRGRQPVILGTTLSGNTGKPVYGAFRMADGMRGNGQTGFTENATVRLVSEQPFLYEDDNAVTGLTLQKSTASVNRVMARINGAWQSLGTGLNNSPFAIAYDKLRNRVFFGGSFTTANGVTVNGVCYWNGTTFVALGSGTVGVVGTVNGITVAPNGDVWVMGSLTQAGGVATNGVARWNNSTNTWTQFNLSGTGIWNAAAIRPSDGRVFVAGTMVDWNGVAANDYVVQYDGTSWSAVGTVPFSSTEKPSGEVGRHLVFDSQNRLLVGSFGTGGATGNVRRWDGSAWSLVLAGNVGASIYSLIYSSDGLLYVAGTFSSMNGVTVSNVCNYNGSTINPMLGGLNGLIRSVSEDASGNILIGGDFTTISLTGLDRSCIWNGTAFALIGFSPPGSPSPINLAVGDDYYIVFDTTGTVLTTEQTTVTNPSGTSAYPVCYLIGPTTGSLTLQWLENQSTGDRLYFNLTVQAGETIEIDLRPGSRQIISDWRGSINTQPISGSDFASFDVLPGSNVMAAFVSGTTTGAELKMHIQPIHDSADGVA